MDFFITRPEHDPATFYLSCWAKELIELAKSKGINTFDFNKERANALEVEKFINKRRPKLVMFNGHGDKDTIRGHKNEILIKYGENERLIKDSIVYCRACNSAAELGKKADTAAFIGYNDVFGFVSDPQRESNPLKDEFAKPCLDTSNQIIRSLLKGNIVSEAYHSSQTIAEKWMEKLQRSDSPPEAPHVLLWLIWNKIHQQVHGDNNAKI